jgi:hypothetical protein
LSFGDDEEEEGEDGVGDGDGGGGKVNGKKKRVNGDMDGGAWAFFSSLLDFS